MTARSRAFGIGMVSALPLVVAAVWYARAVKFRSMPAVSPPASALQTAADHDQDVDSRRRELAAWIDDLQDLMPDEPGGTAAPRNPAEAQSRLDALARAHSLATDNIVWLLDRAASQDPPATTGTVRLLLTAYARRDAPAAVHWMAAHLSQHSKWDACWKDVGRLWALHDPAGLAAWHRSGNSRDFEDHLGLTHNLVGWIAPHDLGLAAELACENRATVGFASKNSLAAAIRTPQDVATVRAVLERFPPDPPETKSDGSTAFRVNSPRNVQASLEKSWPLADPEGWREYLESRPTGAYGENLWLDQRMQDLAQSPEPTAVAEEIMRDYPPDSDRQNALVAIVRTWSATDPQAALDWAVRRTPPDNHLPLVRAVATRLLSTEPATAIDLWAQLPASPRRDDELAAAFDSWHALDPAAAQTHRTQAAWPPEIERAIHERLITRPPAREKKSY
jgi:hypothetical protein